MNTKNRFLGLFCLVITLFLALIGCTPRANDPNALTMGVIAGPETQLLKVAQTVAQQRYGLSLHLVEFSDYSLPNRALNDGSLDANLFQHKPFLKEEIDHQAYSIVAIAPFFTYPMGIYSTKLKRLSELKPHAIVAIPNDPSNEARALLLLQKAGLIQLKPQTSGFLITPQSIQTNPKQLQFKELDAAQLTRALPDVSCAVINMNYALLANLSLKKDALFSEDQHSIYTNLLVVKNKDKTDPRLKRLILALHSPEVKKAAAELFQGQALPAW
jgi:D-methionine transport system substrate-binding protein